MSFKNFYNKRPLTVSTFSRNATTKEGFTLIELLIVIAIIAILAAAVIIAVNPGEQLAKARDATRERHVQALESALYVYQYDNGIFPIGITTTLTEICNTNIEGVVCGELIDLSNLEIASIPVDPRGGVDNNGTGYFVQESIAKSKIFLTAKKIETRSVSAGNNLNLVKNGMGEYGDLTNFSQFHFFDKSAFLQGFGSFQISGRFNTIQTSEPIPVNKDAKYEICTAIRSEWIEEQPRFYAGVAPYDIDGNLIESRNVMWIENTTTEIVQPLSLGDYQIHLLDSTNWYSGLTGHMRSVGVYPYFNSKGESYPDYTYTRHIINDAWEENQIDHENNIVNLKNSWNISNPNDINGTWPIGTKIANHRAGGTYMYAAAANLLTPSEWAQYCGVIEGVAIPGTNPEKKFRNGTEFVKILWLLNRQVGDSISISWVDEVSFQEIQ